MTISQAGLDLIKEFEGLHDGNKSTPLLEPMRDPIGLYTLGWGSRYDAQGKEVTSKTAPITLEQANTLLRRDVGITERTIATLVKVPLNQNQFDAVCSLIFNIGSGNFRNSNLLRALNDKKPVTQTHFTNWSKGKIKGQLVTIKGLYNRRVAEHKYFNS